MNMEFHKKESHSEPSNMDKIRNLMKSKQKEIFSADPKVDDGNYGSAIVVIIIGQPANMISRKNLTEILLADEKESLSKKDFEKIREKIENRVKATIDNLLVSNVISEKDGILMFNLS